LTAGHVLSASNGSRRPTRSSCSGLATRGTGVPVRATVTSFGPTLLSKVLELNDTQESSLGLVFHYADRAGLPLLDLKDLRAVRWLLAELFEMLPEAGDLNKPKLVFFFDEAHLLFKDASRAFTDALVRTVRLIRSKGVGVFFVTQTPKDVHEDVLAQLGSRIQHQLRAFTPNDAAALKATVRTFPTSPYDLEELLTIVGIGEAVVTVMSEKGAPTPVAHAMLPAPQSLMAPSAPEVRERIVVASPLASRYTAAVDRQSAYEMLTGKIAAGPGAPLDTSGGLTEEERLEQEILGTGTSTAPPPAPTRPAPKSRSRSRADERAAGGVVERVLGSKAVEGFLRSTGTALAREITRGMFGTRRRR
jgi:uncharacterized protein